MKGPRLEDNRKRWDAWRGRMQRTLAEGEGQVRIGIFAGDAERRPGDSELDASISNVELGAIHEFGLGVPERSFLRSTMDVNREKYLRAMKRAAKTILEGNLSSMQALHVMGAMAAADVKRRITAGEGIPPPLAAATIRAKGSSRPLVDTGQLLNSVSFVYVRGSDTGAKTGGA